MRAMPDTFEGLTFLPGGSAGQSIVRIEFRDGNRERQTRTITLDDALFLARALEPVREEAKRRGWV
jgi:hypothetical protein